MKGQIDNLKHQQLVSEQPIKICCSTPKHKLITKNSNQRKHGLCGKQRPATKYQLNCNNQLCQKNYEKEIKIQRTIENATFFQFSAAGNMIDVSNKHFTKYVHHLQSKNLNFVPTIKNFNRKLHYINRKL